MKKWILIAFAVLISVTAAGSYVYLRMLLPVTEGEIKTPYIAKQAEVVRDSWGIPHITASSAKDAWFTYGFTVAQDRLFQMDIQRRLAKGELSEILGNKLVKYDRLFRSLMIKRTVEKYLADEKKLNPQMLEALDAYLAGVNHFISTGTLPLEFKLLGYTPAPFTRVDSAAVLGYMAYSFMEGIESDSLHSILAERLSERNAADLFPGYSKDKQVTIMETPALYSPETSRAPGVSRFLSGDLLKADADIYASGGEGFSPSIEAVISQFSRFDGSNSWVLAPSRTESGGALLANDPHIALSNPAIWYEAHIKYPGYENYGVHVAAVPFPMIGHNRTRGWALTMLENDDADLFYEEFSPDGKQVKSKGEWKDVQFFDETIIVKGSEPVQFKLAVTPHGPVITEHIKDYEGKPVSLYWVFNHAYNPVLDVLYEIGVADDTASFEKAVLKLAAPGLNFSYADASGNIAWWAAARIVTRPWGVKPDRILEGASGLNDPTGFLDPAMNPKMINPPSGVIITGNNKPTVLPVGKANILEGYWCPTDRAARIAEIISSRKKWDIESTKKAQTDLYSISAPGIVKTVVTLLTATGVAEKFTPKELAAFEVYKKWDYESSLDSAGASMYHFVNYHILRTALVDELGDDTLAEYPNLHGYWNFFKALMADEKSPYWDNVSTRETEQRADVVAAAFKAAAADLDKRLGGDPAGWKWGRIHRIEYSHPVGSVKPLNLLFNLGPYPAPGEAHMINRMKAKFGKQDYTVTSCPSFRRIIDYGNFDATCNVITSGNSGNFMSKNYGDQIEMFLAGQYRVVNYSDERIKSGKTKKLVLKPAK